MSEAVQVDHEEGIAKILLNRPEALNALNDDMARKLSERLGAMAVDAEVRAIVLSGRGRAFCAGGDLRWVQEFPGGSAAGLHKLAGLFHRSIIEIRRMDKPVIAAINGVAAGAGFSLALACDFRVMAQGAVLRQAYTAAGLAIDGGGTFTLPRLVGLARALEIAAFDPTIDSLKALNWGLVTRVVEDSRVESEGVEMARDLIARSLTSFSWSKRLLSDSFDRPLEVQLEREREGIVTCAALPDGREGIRAFTEKRKPVFGQAR
ncbi:MAG: enoyl-CoA hydratase-related protein [Terriglobia bacterium]